MEKETPKTKVKKIFYGLGGDVEMTNAALVYIANNGCTKDEVVIHRARQVIESFHPTEEELKNLLNNIKPYVSEVQRVFARHTPHILVGWDVDPSAPKTFGELTKRIRRVQDTVRNEMETSIPQLDAVSLNVLEDVYRWQTENLLRYTATIILQELRSAVKKNVSP